MSSFHLLSPLFFYQSPSYAPLPFSIVCILRAPYVRALADIAYIAYPYYMLMSVRLSSVCARARVCAFNIDQIFFRPFASYGRM